MLASKQGLGADNILEWEVVTGDGRHPVATPTQNSDLYWRKAPMACHALNVSYQYRPDNAVLPPSARRSPSASPRASRVRKEPRRKISGRCRQRVAAHARPDDTSRRSLPQQGELDAAQLAGRVQRGQVSEAPGGEEQVRSQGAVLCQPRGRKRGLDSGQPRAALLNVNPERKDCRQQKSGVVR